AVDPFTSNRPAFGQITHAAANVGRGGLRIEFDRLVVILNGAVVLSNLAQSAAAAAVRGGESCSLELSRLDQARAGSYDLIRDIRPRLADCRIVGSHQSNASEKQAKGRSERCQMTHGTLLERARKAVMAVICWSFLFKLRFNARTAARP